MNSTLKHPRIIRSVVTILFLTIIPAVTPILAQANKSPGARQAIQPKVTFVELGSVKCVPCKMMQPVMESIGKKYGGQVSIVFHDVWTDSGKTLAEPYNIRAIPTQVFLDQKGIEIFRHEGFYPESEIDKLLQKQGLKVLTPPAK
jgi:thioredoxin 1